MRRQRLAGEDEIDAQRLRRWQKGAGARRFEAAIEVGVAGFFHLRHGQQRFGGEARPVIDGLKLLQYLWIVGNIPRADRVEVAHDQVGAVAVAHQPRPGDAQLDGARGLTVVVQVVW